MLDIDQLLIDHEGETACGENFEYDALLIEARNALEGKPAQQIGTDIIEGEEPDWRLVKKNCLELCGKTHNLEVIVSLTQALMHIEGFSGLADGAALLAGTIEKFWDCLHPQIDPDDNDPIERLNMLAVFEDFNFLLSLQKTIFISSKGIGSVSLYDIQNSKVKTEETEDNISIDSKLIEAVFMSSLQNDKENSYASLDQCIRFFEKISDSLKQQETVGISKAPSFSELLKNLSQAKSLIGEYLDIINSNDSEVSDGGNNQLEGVAMQMTPSKQSSGINSREDVLLSLQKIVEYYYKHEPGSPIPLLLLRAKSLVDKDFISLMEDLAPDSISQVELVLGSVRAED